MVYDRLAAGRPLLITRPVDPEAEIDEHGYLSDCEWLDADSAGDIVAALDRLRDDPEAVARLEHWVRQYFGDTSPGAATARFHEAVQRLMDEYAGGSSQFYRANEYQLDYALRHIKILQSQFKHLRANDLHDLMQANETMDRVDVAEAVVHHLKARKETRWAGWQTRSDYPQRDDENFDCFVESRRDPVTGEMTTFTRPYEQLLPGDRYKP